MKKVLIFLSIVSLVVMIDQILKVSLINTGNLGTRISIKIIFLLFILGEQ